MIFVCEDCGCVFGDEDMVATSGVVSEVWGVDYCEEDGCCPRCKSSSVAEGKKCAVCGGFYSEDDIHSDVCNSCIEKYGKDFEFCERVCEDEKVTIRISSLLASLFDESDIEAILREYIKNKMGDVDCKKFVEFDKDWFAERIVEEVKKNEDSKN